MFVVRYSKFVLVIILLSLSIPPTMVSADDGAGTVSYRGPDRNGIFPASGLMKAWPEGGPELVWQYGNLGPSWASVVVAGEIVYVPGGGSFRCNWRPKSKSNRRAVTIIQR